MYEKFDYNDLECQKKVICEVMREPQVILVIWEQEKLNRCKHITWKGLRSRGKTVDSFSSTANSFREFVSSLPLGSRG